MLYAKICHSHYCDGKDKKTYTNLGRVLDKEKGIYKNRERGIYSYNEATGEFKSLNEESLYCDSSKKKQAASLLSFGDVWFLDQFMKQDGSMETLDSISCKNRDSLICLIWFYILNNFSIYHAQDWLESSYAKYLYPNANLKSQPCSELLEEIGFEETYKAYFQAHIESR